MEDTHSIAGAILFGLGIIAAAIRWGAGRLIRAQDRSTAALVESTRMGATLTAKFEVLVSRFDHLAARFDRIVGNFVSGKRRRFVSSSVVRRRTRRIAS